MDRLGGAQICCCRTCAGSAADREVQVLDSWEHMGMAHAQCLSGCTCEEAVFDSNHHSVCVQRPHGSLGCQQLMLPQHADAGRDLRACRHVSLVYWKPLSVQVLEESTCLIKVTNHNHTTSGEHKVKVRTNCLQCCNLSTYYYRIYFPHSLRLCFIGLCMMDLARSGGGHHAFNRIRVYWSKRS